jgi:hypothetical protein
MLIHFLSLTNHCLFVVLHPLSIDLFGGGDPAATALLFAIRKAVPYKLGNLGFAVFIPGGSVGWSIEVSLRLAVFSSVGHHRRFKCER